MIYPTEVQRINKDIWFRYSAVIKRVMGKLMRCGAQFIAVTPDYYGQISGEI